MKRLLLHIGLEKTGSTSFQAFCAENRDRLKQAGVLYPINPACFLKINHAPLAASYFTAAEAATLLIAGRRADRAESVAVLKAEIADAELALISAEHFSSRFDPGRIAALGSDFRDCEVSIVVVVRNPLARAVSAYATTVASGRDISLDAFVDELCEPSNPYLISRKTIQEWSDVFGRERMIVVAYREGSDIVSTLAERLSSRPIAAGAYRRNVSPSAEDIERRRRANSGGPATRLRAVSRRWTRALLGSPSPVGPAKPSLSSSQSSQLTLLVKKDLEWLAQEYGIDFRRNARDPPI